MGGSLDGLPDVAIIEVDLSALGEVQVFRPGMAVVDDEFCFATNGSLSSLIFDTVVDILASDVPQDDRPFEDLFQVRHIVDFLFPNLYFLAHCGCESLAP